MLRLASPLLRARALVGARPAHPQLLECLSQSHREESEKEKIGRHWGGQRARQAGKNLKPSSWPRLWWSDTGWKEGGLKLSAREGAGRLGSEERAQAHLTLA